MWNLTIEVDINVSEAVGAAGGITRDNESGGEIIGCVVTGSVTGDNRAGGIAAYNYGTIKACAVTGDVTATGNIHGSGTAGGIVGDDRNGSAAACYYSGEVTAKTVEGADEEGKVTDIGTKVDSWTDTEIKAMNAHLTDCEYEFALDQEKQPILVKKGSTEQAAWAFLGVKWEKGRAFCEARPFPLGMKWKRKESEMERR